MKGDDIPIIFVDILLYPFRGNTPQSDEEPASIEVCSKPPLRAKVEIVTIMSQSTQSKLKKSP